MTPASDAFGMLAAAVYLRHEPWMVGVERKDKTPLCLAWGHYMDAPATVTAGAWLGGWERVPWPEVASWPSLDPDVRRLDAYTLGTLARNQWEEASARGEHGGGPHRFNATILSQYRCRCGAWASCAVEYNGRPKFTLRGKTRWRTLDRKLAKAHDPAVPLPDWVQDIIARGVARAPQFVSREDTTARVDEVIAGRRRA